MDQEKIWDYFQCDPDSPDTFKTTSRYRFLADRILPGSKVLNIGVGRGGLESVLLGKNVEIYSLDPSEKSIESIQSRFGEKVKSFVGYSQKLPFEDSYFDVIVMSEVLEHLADDVLRETFHEIRRTLRSGGKFIGTVPADEDLNQNKVICPDCGKVFHRWGHVQEFSRERLVHIIGSEFNVIKIKRNYYCDKQELNWKGRLSFVLKKVLVFAGIKGSGETFFFVATKRP